MTWPIGSAST